MKIFYNKLVRDRIPEIIEGEEKKTNIRIADQEEYFRLLKDKLVEEVDEFLDSDSPQELPDILEVVIALGSIYGLSFKDLSEMAEENKNARGGFNNMIVLVSVDE
ncbi:nucleoside triphosphate pyrophosphohydrolase [Candidatus Contubernalis alkaliaceticus]|uniref:nucleoside triphosphate pyrophosphohydrolase n=1 Tax=Candidatus Contubernalis alkaliaceticus TaxID=338645 RepID=UPI001F4C1439|nr:nucleoside triphosphate pyrophosphohydrolase [Candidatus Contubernalis alkalaceticus]UNC91280.1 nucleoside triphosphate pyrophosphohydrolase [Candidatus Contubernalis alkalaceticus]